MSSIKKGLRRAGVGGLSAILATTAMTGFASMASATPTFSFDRVAGADRYATSVEAAKLFGASTNVILASGMPGHTVDALSAAYLAGVKNAPILLTKYAATPANVAAEMTALGAKNVFLVGGNSAISDAQAATLGASFTVKRLGGLDRYLTGAAVIAEGGAAASHTALVATGVTFPDALGAGSLSYVKGLPLAITKTDSLPASTLKALQDAGTTDAIVLGGPTVVTQNVIDALAAGGIKLFSGAGVTNGRIAGQDRAETSSKLADFEINSQGFSNTAVNVASGYVFGDGADALGGAALSGKENRPTLITKSDVNAGVGVINFLTAHAPTLDSGHIFGGVGAVAQPVQDAMTVAARGTVAAGPIALTSATVAQGGTLAGTVANAASISSISVTGCGITNVNVPVAGDGTISLLIPASQAPGACNLVFNIVNTNGTTTTQTVPVTVTATAKGVTAAPDLLSAAIVTGTNNVTYTFDAPLAVVTGVTFFHVYNASGTEINPVNLTSSGSTVTADFSGSLSEATTATVDLGAVKDANGRFNPINAVPLQTVTLAKGVTDAPDLVSVGNPHTVLGVTTFDFTFDAPVTNTVNSSAAQFAIISTGGAQFLGGNIVNVSVDKQTLTVSFQSLDAGLVPVSQVVRGFVNTAAVSDGTLVNPLEAAKVGTLVTTAPNLLSVAVVATDVVRYTFDKPVNGALAQGNLFRVFNSSGVVGATETPGNPATAAVNGNAAAVDVTFASTKVARAVGASSLAGAVTGTTGTTQPNATDELGLQSVTFQAGRTAAPDLVSVTKATDVFGTTTVKYTFDDALAAAPNSASLFLYDATGTQFAATGTAVLSNGNKTVTVTNGFSAAVLSAAIIGAVDDNVGPDLTLSTPAFPEGAANVN